jgi:hypothetical protein
LNFSENGMSAQLNRRQLLLWGGGTALALVFAQSVLAATPLTTDDFLSLSARLLQKDVASLNADYAQSYLEGLGSQGAGLESLAAGTADTALENRIIASWYTGLNASDAGEEVVTYTDAMLWQALDYSKPMGWCGGETGYWSSAPEGEA